MKVSFEDEKAIRNKVLSEVLERVIGADERISFMSGNKDKALAIHNINSFRAKQRKIIEAMRTL